MGDWDGLVLSQSGWNDEARRSTEAIAAAKGLPANPGRQEWLVLITGASMETIAIESRLIATQQ